MILLLFLVALPALISLATSLFICEIELDKKEKGKGHERT